MQYTLFFSFLIYNMIKIKIKIFFYIYQYIFKTSKSYAHKYLCMYLRTRVSQNKFVSIAFVLNYIMFINNPRPNTHVHNNAVQHYVDVVVVLFIHKKVIVPIVQGIMQTIIFYIFECHTHTHCMYNNNVTRIDLLGILNALHVKHTCFFPIFLYSYRNNKPDEYFMHTLRILNVDKCKKKIFQKQRNK